MQTTGHLLSSRALAKHKVNTPSFMLTIKTFRAFSNLSEHKWNLEEQKAFLESVSQKLNINSFSDWYKVTQKGGN